MKEGTVAAWLVDEGDEISPGDEVMDVETEKISSAVEASESGILRQQVANEGETLPVGALLGVISNADSSDEDINTFIAEFQANYVPPADDEEDAGAATESLELEGRNIRYLVKGDGGSPLILVHGFGGISLNQTGQAIECMAITMATYLFISLTISLCMNIYNRSIQFKEK